MNDSEKGFEPREVDEAATRITDLRTELHTAFDTGPASVFAEEHFHLALTALEQAGRFMKLASYHQANAIAAGRR